MYRLNRESRFQIIRKLIEKASVKDLNDLLISFGLKSIEKNDDVEERRKELLYSIDEFYDTWKKYNIDVTDRQFITIEEPKRKYPSEVLRKK